jgi:hypothetical protein
MAKLHIDLLPAQSNGFLASPDISFMWGRQRFRQGKKADEIDYPTDLV